MNKKHWNQLNLYGSLTDELIKSLIRHSYNEVVKKIPRRTRENFTSYSSLNSPLTLCSP
jgi:predicted DNA-binding protein (MmcQ/YjbR family)